MVGSVANRREKGIEQSNLAARVAHIRVRFGCSYVGLHSTLGRELCSWDKVTLFILLCNQTQFVFSPLGERCRLFCRFVTAYTFLRRLIAAVSRLLRVERIVVCLGRSENSQRVLDLALCGAFLTLGCHFGGVDVFFDCVGHVVG